MKKKSIHMLHWHAGGRPLLDINAICTPVLLKKKTTNYSILNVEYSTQLTRDNGILMVL